MAGKGPAFIKTKKNPTRFPLTMPKTCAKLSPCAYRYGGWRWNKSVGNCCRRRKGHKGLHQCFCGRRYS